MPHFLCLFLDKGLTILLLVIIQCNKQINVIGLMKGYVQKDSQNLISLGMKTNLY